MQRRWKGTDGRVVGLELRQRLFVRHARSTKDLLRSFAGLKQRRDDGGCCLEHPALLLVDVCDGTATKVPLLQLTLQPVGGADTKNSKRRHCVC